jgi:hypothetical protein
MLAAIQKILENMRKYWPLTARQLHYNLLNDPPLRHASKPSSRYSNDAGGRSYKDLINLLTRARLDELIPYEAIGDETRPVSLFNTFHDFKQFIRQERENFLWGYWRDLLQSQPNHIEVFVEKLTMSRIIKPVVQDYGMPMTVGRGQCSTGPVREIAQRYLTSGKQKLVLLLLTDHDPEGEEIARSVARRLHHEHGVEALEPHKVAVTAEQTTEYSLPPSGKAKKTSTNSPKFIEQYGDTTWELESVPPELVQELLRNAINTVLDIGMFNREVDAEKQDSQFLTRARRQVMAALATLPATEGTS